MRRGLLGDALRPRLTASRIVIRLLLSPPSGILAQLQTEPLIGLQKCLADLRRSKAILGRKVFRTQLFDGLAIINTYSVGGSYRSRCVRQGHCSRPLLIA